MYEKLDVYDENRNKTGRIIERKEGEILSSDEYILAIQCWIINSNNEILLTKRKTTKKDGNMWEPTGGLVQSGENSMDGAKRELKEEIGISVDDNDLILLKTNTEKGNVNVFRDVYVINKDIQINHLEFIDSEVSDAKYVTFEEFKNMIDIIPNENIKEIKVKKYSILTSKLKSITIKTNDKKTHQLFANLEESTIPYHKENFAKFASKYEK